MRVGVAVVIAMGVAACHQVPPWKPSDAMERSGKILAALDRLEADLHQGVTEAVVYSELVERHGQAQQIACKVTDEHVQEIHRLDMAQQEKIKEKRETRRKRKLVAQVSRHGRTLASR